MKISTRTQIILAATVIFFILALFAVANTLIQSSYTQIELKQSDTSIQLVADQIQYDTDQLGTKARDWAVWDDTYQFMVDNNSHFRDTVIRGKATYETLRLSGLILFDGGGTVIASQGYDLQNKTLVPLSDETLATVSGTLGGISNVRGGKKKEGMILLSDGPALIGMHAILQTNGIGYGHGTLVMLQPFDEQHIASIRNHIHLPVQVWRLDTPPAAMTPDIASLTAPGAPSHISRIQNASSMAGYSLLADIKNTPILLFGVETPRSLSREMSGMLIYIMAAFAVIGVFYIIITGFLLRRTIINPLTDLDAAMTRIGSGGDLEERLPVGDGDDEITSLRQSFNTMLGELQEKKAELARQREELAEAHRKATLYLDIYLDVLSYEILNVTISLQAYAELIRERGDVTTSEYADRITIALNRNLSVIRNIETISKIYKHPPGMTKIQLRDIVEKAVRDFPGMDIRYDGGDCTVLADEMLGTVFHNLLQNAVRFGRDDLQVRITAEDLPGGMVEVSVSDNGTGIADDMKPLIFDRFMKGSDKRSSYGLGLHIVKMLIEAYGGNVRADDRIAGKPDEGAAIRFTLHKG